LLSTIDPKKYAPPQTIPLEFIENYFDELAPYYKDEFVDDLAYRGYFTLCDNVDAFLKNQQDAPFDLLDVGCGTGLCAAYAAEKFKINTTVGVDISANMLNEAKQRTHGGKPLFNFLNKEDFCQFPASTTKKFDIILAACSLHYYYNLHSLIMAYSKLLNPGGIMAFSVESTDKQDYCYNAKLENFCFSRDYVEKSCHNAGFKKIQINTTQTSNSLTNVFECVVKL